MYIVFIVFIVYYFFILKKCDPAKLGSKIPPNSEVKSRQTRNFLHYHLLISHKSSTFAPLFQITKFRTTDTRYFVDPSIATASLGLSPDDLMHDLNTFG